MRWLFLGVLLWPTLAQAADLSKIDRAIKKEPIYKGKPKYGLLLFGREAKTRVWVILDGTDLYVDKNGDGSLTAEERFPQDGRELKEFDVAGGYKVKHVSVHRDERDKRVFVMASVEVAGKYRQYGDLSPVENRQRAPSPTSVVPSSWARAKSTGLARRSWCAAGSHATCSSGWARSRRPTAVGSS